MLELAPKSPSAILDDVASPAAGPLFPGPPPQEREQRAVARSSFGFGVLLPPSPAGGRLGWGETRVNDRCSRIALDRLTSNRSRRSMNHLLIRQRAALAVGALSSSSSRPRVAADGPAPPWIAPGEMPIAPWVRSVAPKSDDARRPGDMVLFAGPSRAGDRRGVSLAGATLPFFAVKRGSGCTGSWWMVGPLAWTCSDSATLVGDEPSAPARPLGPDGLAHPYFFVGRSGASAYTRLDSAVEGAADRELEGGWGVAVTEERSSGGDRWAHTTKGLWIAARDLGAARPSLFHGEEIAAGKLDLAWVLADKAEVWDSPARSPKSKAKDARVRFQVVHVLEESGAMVRVEDGWMRAVDLARPRPAPSRPKEVSGDLEHWIDVELATQTLVAYEGSRPTYATLVSTGRGRQGTDSATPLGVHRIWVKLLATDMDNVERDDVEAHYSLEDVPYVQFFDHAVGLHGTYWHHDFGHVKSHGCVNLSPLDAKWLFGFTEPRMPAGWAASYPVSVDEGSVVRVR